MLLALAALVAACSDPPDPPPAPAPGGLPRWSTAPHIAWAGPDTPVDRPIALIVDQPGGRLDRAMAHADVTTFLNDRFTPVFLTPDHAPGMYAGSLQVVTPGGCWLVTPTMADSAGAVILTLNAGLEAAAMGVAPKPRPSPPAFPDFPPDHPLRQSCTGG
ncbi:MAG: hypothetical protein H6742_02445 [Alphaproteobacteria bacterium]|nr:hypothetical protein [Alphaproteobacteria bacterium]